VSSRVIIFDFDGVLIESYSCFPNIYKHIAKKVGIKKEQTIFFIKEAMYLEDLYDGKKIYDRGTWWPKFFKKWGVSITEIELDKLHDFLWNERINQSNPIDAKLLRKLHRHGFKLCMLCGNDGKEGLKQKRIKRSKLDKLVDKIYVVGDNVKDRIEGIKKICNDLKVETKQLVVVDDKPSPINAIKEVFPEICAVKIDYKDQWFKAAWQAYCKADVYFKNVEEFVEEIIAKKERFCDFK